MLVLQPLTAEGLTNLFPKLYRDFPENEIKPLERFQWLMASGHYEGWLAVEDGVYCGYALILRADDSGWVLLDYLCVEPEMRNRNVGSRMLTLLAEQYPGGIFLEADDPAWAEDEGERTIRTRRLGFYRRAGYLPTEFYNSVFGAHFVVHLRGKDIPEKKNRFAARLLDSAYRFQFDGKVYDSEIQIDIPD